MTVVGRLDCAIKSNTLEEPFSGMPVFVLSFAHIKVSVVAANKLVFNSICTLSLTQKLNVVVLNIGAGLTLILKDLGRPSQPFKYGVTTILAT